MESRYFISTMLRTLAIDNPTPTGQGRPSIWAAFAKAVAATPALVQQGPMFLAFRERRTSDGPQGDSVLCRRTAVHSPPFTAWGLPFRVCGKGCSVNASRFTVRTEKDGCARTSCFACGWKSCKVRRQDISSVHPIAEGNEAVFWHAFPVPPHVDNAFVSLTDQRRT